MSVTIFDHVVLAIPIISLLFGVVKLLLSGLDDQPQKPKTGRRNSSTQMKTDAQSNSLVYRLFS